MLVVTAILPTRGRAEFAARAVACFRAQTWPEKELLIVDDADLPSFPEPPAGIGYVRVPRRLTIGAKRNLACSRAQGDVVIHFDDDDWSAPQRMTDQVERLIATGAPITGYHSMLFEDTAGRRWKYCGNPHYALGTSLCYEREFWQRQPFPDRDTGEDNAVVMRARAELVAVDAGELMVARIHSGNTSPKRPESGASEWSAA